MEKFVLVMVFGGQVHAYGLFVTERGCFEMGWAGTRAAEAAHANLINICYRESLYREMFPSLPIEEPAT